MPQPGKTIFGIDLGTTYSCIARVDEFGQPVVLANSESQVTTPSVVYFETDTNIVVGEVAKESTPLAPTRVASLFKRAMGDEEFRFLVDGAEPGYRPQEISKFVLQKLAQDAEIATGIKVEDVIITCPAYFGIAQKEATKQAGELAGLNVRNVIFEPVAAAIAYGLRSDREETVLVYDLGGGTFDVTLIDIRKDALTVLTTGGDARLGGSDWDIELARHLATKLADSLGQPVDSITADREFYAQLLLDAEKMKRSLTTRESVKQKLSFGGGQTVVEMTRTEFDQVTSTLLERSITLTKQTLENAARDGHPAPTRICLVGGSSFMPQVKRRLAQEYPSIEMQLEDPNLLVAKGAAQFGFNTVVKDEVLSIIEKTTGKKIEDLSEAKPADIEKASTEAGRKFGLPGAVVKSTVEKEITIITSRGFGVKVWAEDVNGFRVACLVHVDEHVPTERKELFPTNEDQQSSVQLTIFETEQRTNKTSPLVEESSCVMLVDDKLELDRPYPKGELIEIAFGLSVDGTLAVNATHHASGRNLPLVVKVKGVMNDDEVAASIRNSGGLSVA